LSIAFARRREAPFFVDVVDVVDVVRFVSFVECEQALTPFEESDAR